MSKQNNTTGVSVVGILCLIGITLSLTGWMVWQAKASNIPALEGAAEFADTSTLEPSEVTSLSAMPIPEWGVTASIPETMRDLVTYSLGELVADPDGNVLQSAKVLLLENEFSGHTCAIATLPKGSYIDSGAQYIRSESSKQFNVNRYRPAFKHSILLHGTHEFHLNYITPDCFADKDVAAVKSLQTALNRLTPYN